MPAADQSLSDSWSDLGEQSKASHDKRLFVVELLRSLHEQYATKSSGIRAGNETSRRKQPANKQSIMNQLLKAIQADGDVRRLIDWIQNSFNLASVGEMTTQFVVGKLGSVNCAALLRPDNEESLMPRFLLFNEHFIDVPYELPVNPTSEDCSQQAHFEPQRKTLILLHGYLSGYTLVDGLTNIKNRVLDLNNFANNNNKSTSNEQQYNVIIVDWFSGANPSPRSRYIRAAVNAQVVGKLLARFLVNLVEQCRAPANRIELLAHSLGKYKAGY